MENKLETHFTEQELQKMGDRLATDLNMKKSNLHLSRWDTAWGTYTGLGLLRLLDRLIDEIKAGDRTIL